MSNRQDQRRPKARAATSPARPDPRRQMPQEQRAGFSSSEELDPRSMVSPESSQPLPKGLPPIDMDVTVLAFAQWVSEAKSRSATAQQQTHAEMSIIRNAISANNTDLSDFKRHSAAIQQQMHQELAEIRESLGNVFAEITAAVRNNSSSDQDLKLKLQSLQESMVRNDTVYTQLADSADKSTQQMQSVVADMSTGAEKIRDELVSLKRFNQQMDGMHHEEFERMGSSMEGVRQQQDQMSQRKQDAVWKMQGEVQRIGQSVQQLSGDFLDQKSQASTTQNELSASLYVLEQSVPQTVLRSVQQTTRMQDSRPAPRGAQSPPGQQVAPQQQMQQQQLQQQQLQQLQQSQPGPPQQGPPVGAMQGPPQDMRYLAASRGMQPQQMRPPNSGQPMLLSRPQQIPMQMGYAQRP